jgi:protease I
MSLNGARVAILAEDLYEDLELWYPYHRLREAGAEPVLAGTGTKATYASKHGYPCTVHADIQTLKADGFDGVVVPGGFSPDKLRRHPAVLQFVRDIHAAGRPVAAICHGPWVLISAGILRGRTVTGVSAIRDDLTNAGATYVDREVVVDGLLVTSRTPEDLPAFLREILAALERSRRAR